MIDGEIETKMLTKPGQPKRKFFLIFILTVTFSLIACGEGQNKKVEWKGKIEKENGVIVVRNPREPLYSGEVLSLHEELSIGEAKEEKRYILIRPWYIAVDDEERIYVMDQGDSQVKVFDKNGSYLRKIGKKGEGPGELQNPNEIFITGNKQLVWEDYIRSLNHYSLGGDFIRSVSTAELLPVGIKVNSRGDILAITNIKEPERWGKEIQLMDTSLNILKTLLTISQPRPNPQIINPFQPGIHWGLAKDDTLVIGFGKDYELFFFNFKGELIKKIKKEFTPVKISEEEVKEVKERVKKAQPGRRLILPENHAALRSLSADDEGRILVETWERMEDGSLYHHDVFDAEGRYVAKIILPSQPKFWKRKKLYTIEEDKDGFQFVKRYGVIWLN